MVNLEIVQKYLDVGLCPLPMKGEVIPKILWGKPIKEEVKNGWISKTPLGKFIQYGPDNKPTIRMWKNIIAEVPDVNIGLMTGDASGDLVALDFDSPEALSAYKCEYDLRVMDTMTAKTGRGQHAIFRLKPGEKVAGKNGRVIKKLDMKSHHNYIIVEPSIHQKTGKMYEWTKGKSPLVDGLDSILDAPEGLYRFIADHDKVEAKKHSGSHSGRRKLADIRNATKNYNDAMTSLIGHYVGRVPTQEMVFNVARLWSDSNAARFPENGDAFTDAAIWKTLKQIWQTDEKTKASAKPSICEAILKQTTQVFPGGDSKYKMDLIDGSHVIVDVDKLDSQPRMLKAMFIATGIRYAKVKADDFYDKLCLLNDNAEQKMMSAEDGELGRIHDLITDMIHEAKKKPVSQEEKEDQKVAATNELLNGIVIKGDLFYVKKKLLLKTISDDGVKAKRPDVLAWLYGNGIQEMRAVKLYGMTRKVMTGSVVTFLG